MASKEDFTPQEWAKVLEAIVAAGAAIAAADPSGWWGTLKEATAGTPAFFNDRQAPDSNDLIQSAIKDFGKTRDGNIITMQERFSRGKPKDIVQHSLETLRQASTILDANAPAEAAQFKSWLYKISQEVAEAAVEGSVLGFGGVRVSNAEKATLKDISEALGIEG